MSRETSHEIYLNGSSIEAVSLEGIAFLKYQAAALLGDASWVHIIHGNDPVLCGRQTYDHGTGGWEWA